MAGETGPRWSGEQGVRRSQLLRGHGCCAKSHSTLVSYRVVLGKAYHDWRAAAGADSKVPYADFVRHYFLWQGRNVYASQRKFVRACAKLAVEKKTAGT